MGLIYTEQPKICKSVKINEIPTSEITNYIIASCSAYPFIKKTKINNKYCYDGLYTDNFPINLAIDMGATKIIAINILNKRRKKIKNKEIDILYLKPSKKLPFFLDFDNKKINESLILGYNDTMNKKEEILNFIH